MELDENLCENLAALRTEELISEDVIEPLSNKLVSAVDRKVVEPIAIAFSGGVDSTLLAFICEKLGKEFSLYSVGFENSKDIVAVDQVASTMGWTVTKKILTLDEMEEIFKKVVAITGKCDPVTVGVGTVTYVVASLAKEDAIMTGLGSEELYAGYERHAGDVHENCWDGLLNIWKRDVVRDKIIVESFNKKAVVPFLDKDVVQYSMSIDPALKVKEEYKKWVLRKAAVSLGLPEEFSFRKKCAAQYGSKVDWAIEKLAKKNNLSKKEYLQSLVS